MLLQNNIRSQNYCAHVCLKRICSVIVFPINNFDRVIEFPPLVVATLTHFDKIAHIFHGWMGWDGGDYGSMMHIHRDPVYRMHQRSKDYTLHCAVGGRKR